MDKGAKADAEKANMDKNEKQETFGEFVDFI